MKKELLIFGIIAFGLLLSGCTQKEEAAPTPTEGATLVPVPTQATQQPTVQPTQEATATPVPTQEEAATPTATPEAAASNTSGVSQEDLDNLKKNIEGMEYEDLGGIEQ